MDVPDGIIGGVGRIVNGQADLDVRVVSGEISRDTEIHGLEASHSSVRWAVGASRCTPASSAMRGS